MDFIYIVYVKSNEVNKILKLFIESDIVRFRSFCEITMKDGLYHIENTRRTFYPPTSIISITEQEI